MSADSDLRDAMIAELETLEVEHEGFIYIEGTKNAERIADAILAILPRWTAEELG